MVPNGVSTGLDIGLSNYSLMLITLSFYTMCKSATPVFLLIFAFIWGLERRACNRLFHLLCNSCHQRVRNVTRALLRIEI